MKDKAIMPECASAVALCIGCVKGKQAEECNAFSFQEDNQEQ